MYKQAIAVDSGKRMVVSFNCSQKLPQSPQKDTVTFKMFKAVNRTNLFNDSQLPTIHFVLYSLIIFILFLVHSKNKCLFKTKVVCTQNNHQEVPERLSFKFLIPAWSFLVVLLSCRGWLDLWRSQCKINKWSPSEVTNR